MEVVIHAAGLVSFTPSDRNQLLQMNHQGTANVVNACLKENCKLLHISSVACITPARPMPCEVDERQGFMVDKDTSDYAVSKHLAELEVFRGREEGLSIAVLNPVIVLAPGGAEESSASLVRYAMKPRLFQPAGWLNYIDARDLAEIVRMMLENNAFHGERMISSGGFIPFPDFFAKVAEQQKIRKPLFTAGPLLAGIGWRLAAGYTAFTGKKQMLTRFTAAAANRRNRYISQNSGKFLTGFTFRSLDETLAWILSKNG
jgi:nucleoside-diphosphate-sugar epimerase